MNPPANMNHDQLVQRMRKWVERIRTTRVFRPLICEASMNEFGRGKIQVFLTDGLESIRTQVIEFDVATMNFVLLYESIRAELTAAVMALVDKRLAPETVFAGTSPVKMETAETDGEELVYVL